MDNNMMNKFSFKILSFLLLSLFLQTAISQTFWANPNSEYKLSTQWQGIGKKLDHLNSNIQLVQESAFSDNLWKISPAGNGYFRLLANLRGQDLALSVQIFQNNFLALKQVNDNSNQLWKITSVGNDYYRLTVKVLTDKKSLDVVNSGPSSSKLQLADTGNYTGQFWKIDAVATSNFNSGNTQSRSPSTQNAWWNKQPAAQKPNTNTQSTPSWLKNFGTSKTTARAPSGSSSCPSGYLPLSGICRDNARDYMHIVDSNKYKPAPGCKWVVNESTFPGAVLLYLASNCGSQTSRLEYASGRRFGTLSLITGNSPMNSSHEKIQFAYIPGQNPSSEILRYARYEMDQRSIKRCSVQKADARDYILGSFIVSLSAKDIAIESQAMGGILPSFCGPFGLDGQKGTFWRAFDDYLWFFDIDGGYGQFQNEIHVGSLTLVTPKGTKKVKQGTNQTSNQSYQQTTSQYGNYTAISIDRNVVKDVIVKGKDIYVKLSPFYTSAVARISNNKSSSYRKWYNGSLDNKLKISNKTSSKNKKGYTYRVNSSAKYIEYIINGKVVLHLKKN